MAWCDELNELGYGDNVEDCVDDLCRTLVELYEIMREEQDRLGPELSKIWKCLQQVVEVTRP